MESQSVVGIDVSKVRLDVAFRPSGKRLTVSNSSRGISRLVNLLKRAVPECVLLEATGGYELKLLERLLAEALPAVVVNARQVREFARATGGWPRPTRLTLTCSPTTRKRSSPHSG